MTNNDSTRKDSDEDVAHRFRFPNFILDEDIGLGDLVKKITYRIGFNPCNSCEKRAEKLNRWVRITRDST